MFHRNQSPNLPLRLTAVALVAALAGCSSAKPSSDFSGVQTATAPPPEPPATTQSQAPEYSGPVVERVNEPTPIASNAPNEYVVQAGDTLWDIASMFLNDPWYWPEIWHINPEIVNPHLIYPGDVLGLVYINGQPRVTPVVASTYRLSPQARITPISQAVTSIPYESVSAFLASGAVLERGQADRMPYMIQARGDHLVASAGNEIYVRGLESAPLGSRYNLVQVGDALIDPDDNKLIGYRGKFVGEGTLRRSGDPGTVALTDTSQEVVPGDKLLPETVDIPLNFYPRSQSTAIDGRIISVVDGVSLIGQYQVVVLNRGARNGLAPGDVLTVFQTGETINDRYGSSSFLNAVSGGERVKLPDEEAGTIMVFKVYDRIGYALVMEATSDIHVLDTVRNPI